MSSTIPSMLQTAMYLLYIAIASMHMMQFARCLPNLKNQSTAICRQIIRVDIEVECVCDSTIYYHRHWYVFFCKCIAQNLVWNWYGSMEDCLPFLKSSIPFWHLPYSIPKFLFHSIFHFMQYHALVVDSILLLSLVHFTPTVVASLKIRKRLILKELLPLPAAFQQFRFRVRFRFQLLSSKCFRFHKKSTASASSFHFHIPGMKL